MKLLLRFAIFSIALCAAAAAVARAPQTSSFTMTQVLGYPYPENLVAAKQGDRIAWTLDERGVRNVWVASGPDFTPRELTHYGDDDGQELTQLQFSPDGKYLVFVRGGDHDANWPESPPPDPDSSTTEPEVTIWAAVLPDGKPIQVASGDEPAISSTNRLAYVKDHQVWSAALDGKGKPARLFFDRGDDGSLRWSPDGSLLAFVSDRDDHAFIGIFTSKDRPLEYLAPSTHRDFSPRWSPDGSRIAFLRMPGVGGPPQPILKLTPEPWAIWI
ncbi:MAG TPA: S9 family peptidase, partial [Gammaproteobacteria bacterium]|nr:S9 family peptidase [Gammaproteobacteria bacterium]